ncbi:zinc finger protein 316-like [Culex pipiens pallens]|uniref:zinc finger protein 316-like n=1 Tax=Culex pipiens pallens TaxID=42434 RepID=UPI001954648D|nr:zinc finger protein 316-like [Culex pipiens pallens]
MSLAAEAKFNPEWTVTCRVCLQEGTEARSSLFDLCPESNLSYCAKVMQCTSVQIRRHDSLPEQICAGCIGDLTVAYRFRVNCESSDAILQSYREASRLEDEEEDVGEEQEDSRSSSEIQIPIGSDVVYSYKPPTGLNVKLVPRMLLENNGEIVMCGAQEEQEQDGVPETPEPLQDDDAAESLITFDDDELAPSTSRADEEEDEGTQERPALISTGLMAEEEEEDIRLADEEDKVDDSSANIFFNAELVYVNKDDLLDQLAHIKNESDPEDWEIIYDEDEDSGEDHSNTTSYFQKLPQSSITEREDQQPVHQQIVLVPPAETNPDPPPDPPAMTPMKTLQTIRKANVPNEEKPTIEAVTTQPGPDGSLETVIRVKRNLKPQQQQHVCKLCNSSYKYKHALETHMRRHRGDKPYKCSDCEKAFVVPFELRRHMRTHTGAKPYKCKFCERKFSDFGSKIKHERTHTGERPYVCEVCDKSFTYSHVLNSHMLTHTGVKKYPCPDCGKRFAKSHHLKAHLNTHYRGGSSSSPNTSTTNNNNHLKSSCSDPTPAADSVTPMDEDDAMMSASSDFRLVDDDDEDEEEGSSDGGVVNPFGQLVNIGDYMIAKATAAVSEDAGGGTDVGDDPLLNVVTVLAANQVAGLVEGDYGNIRIISGSVREMSRSVQSVSAYKARRMTACR